jgi:hypothetical protein
MADVRFTMHEMPTGTDDTYAYSIEATCFYDSTAGYAVQMEVVKEKAGTEYTA